MSTEHTFVEEEYKATFNWKAWRRILGFAAPYRRTLAFLAAVSVTMAGFEVSFALVIRFVLDHAVARGAGPWLAGAGGVYLFLVMGLCTGVWLFIRLGGRIATGVSHDIRRDAFAKLQELSFAFYDRRPVGWLMARLTSDCDRLSRILGWRIVDGLWATTLITGISVVMLLVHWRLALATFAVVPVLIWVSVVFRRLILRSSREMRKANSYVTAAYNESIMGTRTTKALVREAENLEEFRVSSTAMYDASVRNALYSALFMPVVHSLGAFATGLVLWYGGVQAIGGALSIGTLIMFLTYVGLFLDPVHVLAHMLTEMQIAQASGERILDLLDTEPEVRDSEEVADAVRRAGDQDPAPGAAADGYPGGIDEIEFAGVGFAYADGPKVLENLDLKVRAGETIALVGPTGGGKTTIVSLMCRFYEPTSGEVRINGVDYRRRSLRWLQSNLGIVLQTPHLFRGPVRDNIRYGRLDASDEEVEAAARLVNAHTFIMEMEQGYDTDVGEGGNRLSMGQKQLVSFARAVLADPRIFVMDEATSSVDTETERLIQKGLRAVLQGRISFVIAHRLSTIRSADRILVIEGGRILEEGPHAELMRRRGRYHDLYMQQFTREREAELLGTTG